MALVDKPQAKEYGRRGWAKIREKYTPEQIAEWRKRGAETRALKNKLRSIQLGDGKYGGDLFREIANKRELWERVLEIALAKDDSRSLLAILEYCTDRAQGKATQTHLVAVQHEVRLSPQEIERLQRAVNDIIEAQQPPALRGG